jgi:hypothetical protein
MDVALHLKTDGPIRDEEKAVTDHVEEVKEG